MVVIDNVVASGATWEAAQKVLPQADLVTLADARRGKNTSAVKSTTEEMMNSRGPMTTAEFVEQFGSKNIDDGLHWSKVSYETIKNGISKALATDDNGHYIGKSNDEIEL